VGAPPNDAVPVGACLLTAGRALDALSLLALRSAAAPLGAAWLGAACAARGSPAPRAQARGSALTMAARHAVPGILGIRPCSSLCDSWVLQGSTFSHKRVSAGGGGAQITCRRRVAGKAICDRQLR